MARRESIACEFCGGEMCEFFGDVDASRLIRAAVVSHFSHCPSRPAEFSGRVLIVYADVLVEAYRRKRTMTPRMPQAIS